MIASLRQQRGVTLMELMIAVAVVGILAAIALPSYLNQRLKTNRPFGEQCLMTVQSWIEGTYTRTNTYTSIPSALTGAPGLDATSSCLDDGGTRLYTVSWASPTSYAGSYSCYKTQSCYSVTATPISGTPQAKDGTLILIYDSAQPDPGQQLMKFHTKPGSTTYLSGWDFAPGN